MAVMLAGALLLGIWAAADVPLPMPTKSQLQWQKNGIMALIHFNMATFFHNGDPGCSAANWNLSKA